MRRLRIDDPFSEGSVLARDLCSSTGEVLARAGMTLTSRATRALRAHGVDLCFVEDAASAGVQPQVLVDATGKDESVARALREACDVLWRFAEGPARRPTSKAVDELRALRTTGTLNASGALDMLRRAVEGFVPRAASHDAAGGFPTDRPAGDDLFGHSLGVAALTVRIGAEIGFQAPDLQRAAMAALLHDVGLLMVPEEIRRTPEAHRTPAQQRRYEDHTLLGQALLSGLGQRYPALPVVAVEHHEEQSGGGYPFALTGGNRILRSASTEDRPPRMALISEIVAVADRYERLVSPAPGVAALTPAAARRVLAAEAGARLNAEVVGRFLDILPQWPLGTEVVLHGGPHDGARAVVIGMDAKHVERPRVRIFADRLGARIEPVDVALAAEPSVAITLAEEAAAA